MNFVTFCSDLKYPKMKFKGAKTSTIVRTSNDKVRQQQEDSLEKRISQESSADGVKCDQIASG